MSYPNIAKTMLCKELLSGVWWQRCFCYIISILFRGFESFQGSEEGRVACTSTTATDQGFLFPFSVLIFIHILTAWTDNNTHSYQTNRACKDLFCRGQRFSSSLWSKGEHKLACKKRNEKQSRARWGISGTHKVHMTRTALGSGRALWIK